MREKSIRCSACGGEAREMPMPYSVDRGGYFMSVCDIAAYVCNICGETFYESAELSEAESIIDLIEKNIEDIRAH